MTFQGGDFGEEARGEAKQSPQTPEARPFPPEFIPPAYAQPAPNAPHNPPASPPVPPWSPPTPDYPPPTYPPPSGYGPPGHHEAPGYGAPSYQPPPPQFGQSYPPPGYGPPGYPSPYDPYQPYLARPHETNGLAIGSLITSIAGLLLGIPLSFVCYIGILIPIVGAVLGIVALNQIKRTNQQGRGLAIAGIAVGATAAVLLVIFMVAVMAAMHSPSSSFT